MYADDTVLYVTSNNLSNVAQESQLLLNNIISWCETNRLTINEKKTKITIFNDNDDHNHIDISYKTTPLEIVKTYKYLGVDICDDLHMDTYVRNVYNKVNYKVYMFSKIRKFITKYAAVMIYKQTIVPYLDYASFLMDSAYQYSLR